MNWIFNCQWYKYIQLRSLDNDKINYSQKYQNSVYFFYKYRYVLVLLLILSKLKRETKC